MFRLVAVIFLITLYLIKISGTIDVNSYIRNINTNIVRVRTVEERDRRSPELAVLDFIGIVEQYEGYTAEEYNITTQDGYILKLHRITGSPLSPARPGKPVIFVQHGFVMSSDIFVAYGSKQALGFLLADAGYDVWFGNFRGNAYSKSHVNYTEVSVHNKEFWEFSIDEMAKYDLPTFIDTVLEKTNKDKLTCIGYSMGASVILILLSTQPEYNEKMSLVSFIAPGSFFTHPLSPKLLALSLTLIPAVEIFGHLTRNYEVLPQSKLVQLIGKDFCVTRIGRLFCKGFLALFCNNLDYKLLPGFLDYTPAGASLKTGDHYYQNVISGKFESYREGIISFLMNLRNTSSQYNLSKITSPCAIYYSESDILTGAQGVKKLRDNLKNVVAFKAAPESFNHVDFVWAFEARETVYNEVLKDIQHFTHD